MELEPLELEAARSFLSAPPRGSRDDDPDSRSPLSSDTSTQPSLPKQRTSWKERFSHWKSRLQSAWMLEVAAAASSTICFCLLCVVLRVYDDQLQPGWISLNAVISVLGTACRLLMLLALAEALGQWKWLSACRKPTRLFRLHEFDNASRGPLGSMKLFVRGNNYLPVRLGAAVVVLIMSLDPFIQQVLSYPIRLAEAATGSDHALVGQARDSAPQDGPNYTPSWETAYHRALWSDDLDIRPSCLSGNCTWPSFHTLGYCNQCTDRTAEASITFRQQPMHGNDTSRGTLTRCEVAIPGYVSGGRFADTTWSLEDTDMMQFLDVLLWDPVISRNIPIQDGYVEVPNLEKPVLELAYAQLGMKQNILESTADPLEALYVHKVTTCRFSMCLWEYNVSIANTSVVTTAKVVDEGRFFYADDDESSICWVPQGGSTRIPANTSIPSEDSLYLDATDLRICGVWDLRFTEFLATVEQLYIRAVNDTNSSTWVYYGAQEMANPGFWRVRAIGFENFMTRLATSLTHTLMDDSNYTIKGTVSEPRAFVKVQWLWLILPALLVLGGNIFFALTVFTSRKEKVLPWKSSSLALFYHGLENVDHDDELYTTAKRMEEMAKTVDLRLEPSDEDGRLVLQKQ